jgi:hypothetical protein
VNTELSSEAKRLIETARGFDSATLDDRVRVQARLLTQLAAGAGLGTVAGSAHAAGAKGWVAQTFARALPKAALGAGAVATVAVGVALSWPTAKTQVPAPKAPASAAPPASVITGVAVNPARENALEVATPEAKTSDSPPPAALPPVALPSAALPSAAAAVSEAPTSLGKSPTSSRPAPVMAPRATRAAAPEVAPGDTSGHLDEELQLVSAARAALKQGESEAALERLGEYQQRFPEGALTVEAQALRVDALCAAGERDASAEAAEAFLKRWPESPLAARVRAACQ